MTAVTLNEEQPPVRRRSRRRGLVVAAILVVLAVLVAVAIAWPLEAGAVRSAVVVRTDAKPWICSSGSVVTQTVGDIEDGETAYGSLAVIAKGMHCQLRLIVDNPTSHGVTLNRITFTLLGAQTAVNVEATQLDGDFSTILPAKEDADADAHFTIPGGLLVDPGSSRLLRLTVAYVDKGYGCTMSAGSSESDFQPTLQLTALGLSGNVTAQQNTYGLAAPAHACS